MATRKISQLSLLATAASNDELLILDVSDTTMGPAGTNKRILVSSLPGGGGGGSGTVTSVDVAGGTGLTSTGGPITTSGTITIDLDNTAVTPGTYTRANITVDQQGRLTSAASSPVLDSTNIYRTGTTGDTLNTDLTAIESDITAIKNRVVYSATETELKVNASNVLDLDATLAKATLTLGGVTAATFSGTRSDLPAVRVGAVATAYDLPTARGTANGEVMKYKTASASAVFEKVDTADLTGTTDNLTEGTTKLLMASAERTKLAGIAAGAEVNQNAFSNVAVAGQTTVAADSKTDTLTLVAGSNITLTTDAATDSITIASSGGGGGSNSFNTIAVAGQSDIVADSGNDTLTMAEAGGVRLYTNATTDTLTISSRTLDDDDVTLSSGRTIDLAAESLSIVDGATSVAAFTSTNQFLYGEVRVGGTPSIGGEVKLFELSTGTNYVGLRAPSSLGANTTFIVPSADGTSGQVMTTNGAGALSFVTKKVTQVTGKTVATGAWSLVSGVYEASISDGAILSTSIVDVIPDNASAATIRTAEMLPRTDSSTGSVKIYSTNLPAASITVTLNIFDL